LVKTVGKVLAVGQPASGGPPQENRSSGKVEFGKVLAGQPASGKG
jgi:hypothetical protein